MRIAGLLLIISSFPLTFFAQPDSIKRKKEIADSLKADSALGWSNTGELGVNFTQSSFTNWSAGGENSFSGTSFIHVESNYKDRMNTWENTIDLIYGRTQVGTANRKSDDRIEHTSKYGRKAKRHKHLFYTLMFNFKSQFDMGYDYPNDSVITSRFMAPGYLMLALGMDYKPNQYFSIMLSPLTAKTTVVIDQDLADKGAFGVEKAETDTSGNVLVPGENIRHEFGGFFKLMFEKEDVFKNVGIVTKVELFSNYLHKPQNVDINWDFGMKVKLGKYISMTLNTQMIYDDDIEIEEDTNDDGVMDRKGPRLQFKEVFGIGISVKF